MATILGEAGRYVSQQATILRQKMWVTAAVSLAGLGAITGFAVASALPRLTVPIWGSVPVAVVCAAAMVVVAQWCVRRLDELERDGEHWRKGATGEVEVGRKLERFPNQFHVINDLATPSGNLDHIVVGPTGVFVLDTKNWRGVVAADGSGELTLNGKALDQPYVGRFIARVMEVKEKVGALAPELDAYFQPVFVFTSARVEVSFGTTSTLHCIRDEQLYQYIVNKRFGKKLSMAEVERIAQAFLGLALMETGFTEQAELVRPAGLPAQMPPLIRLRTKRHELAEAGV